MTTKEVPPSRRIGTIATGPAILITFMSLAYFVVDVMILNLKAPELIVARHLGRA